LLGSRLSSAATAASQRHRLGHAGLEAAHPRGSGFERIELGPIAQRQERRLRRLGCVNVQGGDDRGHGAVGQGDDDPQAAPYQPGADQDHRPPLDVRPGPEVVPQPDAGLGDPGL